MTERPDGSGPSAPAGITPRWEWRTFGDRFDVADALLARSTPERTQSSDEHYFLSTRSDASVKVRDELMDVKVLLEVDADRSLQLWTPVLKAAFPVSETDVDTVLSALGLDSSTTLDGPCAMERLVTEVIEPHPDLIAVHVHKERSHFDVEGCMVESTEITVDGIATRTMTIESTDPDLVVDTVERLGFAGRPNVSVAAGLKSLVGFGARRLAVIDVGTNSVKFHIGERRADGTLHTVADRAAMTRLGEGQSDSGELAEAPVTRTAEAIGVMVDDARRAGADIVAVGTAGLRRAPNRAALIDAVQVRTGVTVEVISGADEARLAYLAATSALAAAQGGLTVFDSGGGSTQFTFGVGDTVDEQFSVDVGAVRVAERFGLDDVASTQRLDEACGWLSSELGRLDHRARSDAIVAIGGTATNLAAVSHELADYDPDIVHGTVIDRSELERQIELYRSRSSEERRGIAGLQPARAEVILGGACIVRTIFDKLGHDEMTVSDRGLRHGVLLNRLPA